MSGPTPPVLEHIASIAWTPLLPVWLLAGLGALCMLAAGIGLIRRASGGWLRLAASLLVLLWLAGPHLVRASWQDLPETALLVIDQSGSMAVGDRAALASRAAQMVQARVRALHSRLGGIALRTVVVPPGTSGGTRLFAAIARATADIPAGQFAGIIAITDGQVHDVPSPRAGRGQTSPAPLDALITGVGEQTDRRLRIIQAPPYGIIGHDVRLRVLVQDLGADGGAGTAPTTATLTLKRDGAAPITREVPVGVPQDIALPVTHPGPTLVQLDVSKLPGEVSTLNNQAVLRINGVRDRLRVLLVSGAPNQGERVWRRLLKADPSVDLVHFTILRPPDKDDTTPLNDLALITFPTRELFSEKIDSFDLIILDGFENRGILPMAYLQNIADFVRGGGGLLVTAGPEFIGRGGLQDTPLGDILPAHVPDEGGLVEERFQPAPTALGRRHPVTAELPQMPRPEPGDAGWGPWFRALVPDESHGEVLLSAPDGRGGTSPLLILDHVDQGRTALLLSDQSWLWSRGEGGGGPQAELLRRIAHWLMKEPDLEEEQLSATMADGRLTIDRRSIKPHPATSVTVVAPNERARTLVLHPGQGSWSASMPATAPGIWEASSGDLHAYAAAQPDNPEEIADLRATAQKLEPLARRSGGTVDWLGGDPASLRVPDLRLVGPGDTAHGPGWIGLRRTGAHVVTGTSSVPLLPPWLVLPLALLLLLSGWWREGRRS
ncbi:VWA domain-containing protein [Lichenicoccus sp.]|uniref:VWA domain-containing protein n=1 Tax=Lichenicoccus sp. TaxID=2781899 RepID=UPI003D1053E4